MAKSSQLSAKTQEDRIIKAVERWRKWREDLRAYWPEIDKQQEAYEFYKSEGSQTSSDVSMNMAFAAIESMVSKANSATLNITVNAHGLNGMNTFEESISSILKDAIEDPKITMLKGSFRKVREVFEREFLIKGDAVAEIQYCYETQADSSRSKKIVLADNPYVVVLPYKSYIFDPAKTFDNSEVKYLEKYVSFDYLKSQELDDKSGRGMYTNLDEVRRTIGKDSHDDDPNTNVHDEMRFVSGDKRVPRKVDSIQLLEMWEGAKLTVIANGSVIIREAYDPKKIGWSGIVTAMNYKQEGRPYAYGEIAAIYKLIRAQDTIMNQSIEIVNKYLRPSVLVADIDADLDAIIQVMEEGGVTYGDVQGVGNIPSIVPPGAAFQTNDSMQQAIERVLRYSPYAAGVPSSSTDKTQGTFHGIQALQQAAEPNFQVKLDAIEESFMEPVARTYLKMIGNLMDDKDIRYGLLQNKSEKWAKATKGILTGKCTIQDLITIGLIPSDEQDPSIQQSAVQELLQGMKLTAADPLESTVVFETEWLITVKLDNQSSSEKQQRADAKIRLLDIGLKMGVQFSPERTFTELVEEEGWEDPESLYMTESEKQQAMQKQQQMMRAENKPPVPRTPVETINFKDLPPEGQAQLAQQAGIKLDPQHFIDHQIAMQAMQKIQPPQPFAQAEQASQPTPALQGA